jgi:hypothetical protein
METRDTRFSRKTILRYVESGSYSDFEPQSVEDEFELVSHYPFSQPRARLCDAAAP